MKWFNTISYVIIAALLLAFWEYKGDHSSSVRVLISSPSLIYSYFIDNFSTLLQATWVTFYEAILGLLIATIFSFGTMIFCFYFPKLMDFILPVMIASQVIPLITLAPLFIILFGAGATATIVMASLLCYFPIFVNFSNGVKHINKNIHELLFIYNATTTQKIQLVYFPLALPYIMTGLKISSTLTVIGAIVAEFSGGQMGLGRNLYLSALRLEPELMMCSLLLSALLGGTMFGFIYFIERKLGNWYRQ